VAAPFIQLLQNVQWRSTLNVPTGPGVAQIMPVKIPNAGSSQGLVPTCGPDLFNGLAFEREHKVAVPADLLLQRGHGFAVEGRLHAHADLAYAVLIRNSCAVPAINVDGEFVVLRQGAMDSGGSFEMVSVRCGGPAGGLLSQT
jgi:hypothetical protein